MGEGEGQKHQCAAASHTPHWGPGPAPRHVPCLGVEPVTLLFAGWCSVHGATPARAEHSTLLTTKLFSETVTESARKET